MKNAVNIFVIGLTASLLARQTALANFEVSASVSIHAAADFYEPLSANGAWIEVGSYGRCWRPAGIAVDWRPYCAGQWVWTDCGWYWESDEPWAWACYHYGYWVYDPVYYWIWIPGIEWAPAWVSWRVGGGYVGWAPLPPPGLFVRRVAPPSRFVFLQSARFTDPVRPSTVIVNNTTIIRETTGINNVKRETRTIAGLGARQVFVNEGPGLRSFEPASARRIKAVSIQEAVRHERVPTSFSRRAHESEPGEKSRPTPARTQGSTPAFRETPAERHATVPGPVRPEPGSRATPPVSERPRPSEAGPHPTDRATHPAAAPERNYRPSEERGHEKGHEKEGGGHGRDMQ